MKWLIIILILILLLAAALVVWNRARRGQIQRDRAQAVELRNGSSTSTDSAPTEATENSSARRSGNQSSGNHQNHSSAKHRGTPGPEAKTWAESQAGSQTTGSAESDRTGPTEDSAGSTPRTAADFLRDAGEDPAAVEGGPGSGAAGDPINDSVPPADSRPGEGGRHRA